MDFTKIVQGALLVLYTAGVVGVCWYHLKVVSYWEKEDAKDAKNQEEVS